MERIKNQTSLNSNAAKVAISNLIDRIAFYGFRSMLFLFFIEKAELGISNSSVLYSWVIISLFFTKIIGGILGDLVLGNKNAVLIGGILQAFAGFCLAVPLNYMLYPGLILLVLGNGFFSPNVEASFGRNYLKTPKMLDAGFTFFHFMSTLGALIGIFLIFYIQKSFGFEITFLIIGCLHLSSIIPMYFSKKITFENGSISTNTFGFRMKSVLFIFIATGIFYTLLDYADFGFDIKMIELKNSLEINFFQNKTISIHRFFECIGVLISFIFFFIFSRFYTNSFFKLLISGLIVVFAISFTFFMPTNISYNFHFLVLFPLFLIEIARVIASPVLLSIITKYANQKYLATVISLSSLIGYLLSLLFIFVIFGESQNKDNYIAHTIICIVGFLILCFSLIFVNKLMKKTSNDLI